jgi:hypothetical protein
MCYGIESYLFAPWVPKDTCHIIGSVMFLSNCEDSVKDIFEQDLQLDCSPKAGIHGV